VRTPASTLSPASCFILCLLALLTLFLGAARAQLPGISDARHDTWMQQVHAIGDALFSYSTDHDGSLPPGKSSTEVFQNLIAGGYVSDPKIFFLPMPGKVSPTSMTLKPENVCFDVTAGVDGNSPDTLPAVFSTGYKITYAAGGSAVPLAKSTPKGIAVAYRATDSSKYMVSTDPDGSVANVVPPTFDAQGKTYQQLTPDGPLGP
jgi:hypothetical protein